MSRIGKLPVTVPDKVTVTWTEAEMAVKGPKGDLSALVPPGVALRREGAEVIVDRADESRQARASHGLARTLLANMVQGVTVGFTRKLIIQGTGYKVEARGAEFLLFTIGYSHPVLYHLPAGITAVLDAKENSVTLSGADRQVLGAAAAEIRKMRPPEPYKGKGIRYADEVIRRKEGKTGSK